MQSAVSLCGHGIEMSCSMGRPRYVAYRVEGARLKQSLPLHVQSLNGQQAFRITPLYDRPLLSPFTIPSFRVANCLSTLWAFRSEAALTTSDSSDSIVL